MTHLTSFAITLKGLISLWQTFALPTVDRERSRYLSGSTGVPGIDA